MKDPSKPFETKIGPHLMGFINKYPDLRNPHLMGINKFPDLKEQWDATSVRRSPENARAVV